MLVLACAVGCGTPPPAQRESGSQGTIQWEPIRSWSGRGDQQLDSFQSSGALRIEWEARVVAGAPTPGLLTIVAHSAISGRPLGPPFVDHRGEGKGIAYISEEPRVFFLDVNSQDVDWKIAVSERVR